MNGVWLSKANVIEHFIYGIFNTIFSPRENIIKLNLAIIHIVRVYCNEYFQFGNNHLSIREIKYTSSENLIAVIVHI